MTKHARDVTSLNLVKRSKPDNNKPWRATIHPTLFKSITEPANPEHLQQLKYAINDHINQPSENTLQKINTLLEKLWPLSQLPGPQLDKAPHTVRFNPDRLISQNRPAAAQSPCCDPSLSTNKSSSTIGTSSTIPPCQSLSSELVVLLQNLVNTTFSRKKLTLVQTSKPAINSSGTSAALLSTATASGEIVRHIFQGKIADKNTGFTTVMPPTDKGLSSLPITDRLTLFGYNATPQTSVVNADSTCVINTTLGFVKQGVIDRYEDTSAQPQIAKNADKTPDTIIKSPSRSPSLLSLYRLTPPVPAEHSTQLPQTVEEAAAYLCFFANSSWPLSKHHSG
jgi:hypothetical protein